MQYTKRAVRGFTLIEILIVIGIIAILAAVVIVAINPARQFAQARDSQRISNINAILSAIGENMADNKGIFGGGCAALPVATTTIDSAAGGTGFNLSCLVPTYIPLLPSDPMAVGTSTGYAVYVDTNGRTHVLATSTEISIPRTIALEVIR